MVQSSPPSGNPEDKTPQDRTTEQQRATSQCVDERTVDEDRRVVPLTDDLRRIEDAREARRRELGVPLDEHEVETVDTGNGAQHRRLPRPGRPFEQHVPARVERGNDELDLASAADDGRPQLVDGRGDVCQLVRRTS